MLGARVEVSTQIEIIRGVVNGDQKAIAKFIELLLPVVQSRVSRILLRFVSTDNNIDLRDEVEELTQEVFTQLFEKKCHLIKSWDSEKGLSLKNYFGMIAEQRAISILRKKTKFHFSEQNEFSSISPSQIFQISPEREIISKQLLRKLLNILVVELGETGLNMFTLIFLEELTSHEISEVTDLSMDAIYAWKSRLRKRIKSIVQSLEPHDGSNIYSFNQVN